MLECGVLLTMSSKVIDPDTKEVEQKHKINVYTVNENTEVNNYGRGILTSIDEGSDVSHISHYQMLVEVVHNPNKIYLVINFGTARRYHIC